MLLMWWFLFKMSWMPTNLLFWQQKSWGHCYDRFVHRSRFQILIVGNTEIIYGNFLFLAENNQLASCNDIKVETTGTNTIATSTMTSSSKSNGAQTTSIRIAPSSTVKVSKAQKKEDNARSENSLAAIMMGYVLVFLICHSPRLILNLHELMTIR